MPRDSVSPICGFFIPLSSVEFFCKAPVNLTFEISNISRPSSILPSFVGWCGRNVVVSGKFYLIICQHLSAVMQNYIENVPSIPPKHSWLLPK